MKEIEIPKSLEIEEFTQQQIININGQQKTLNMTTYNAICPNCKVSLMSFQQGTKKVDIIKHLSQQQDLNYCIKCGQRLKKYEIIDINAEAVNREENE